MEVGFTLAGVTDPGHEVTWRVFPPDEDRCLCDRHEDVEADLELPDGARPVARLQHVLQDLRGVRTRVHKHVAGACYTAVHLQTVTCYLTHGSWTLKLGKV